MAFAADSGPVSWDSLSLSGGLAEPGTRWVLATLLVPLLWLLFRDRVWKQIRFRELVWWAARGGGGAWRWLTTGWQGAVVLLMLVGGATWLLDWAAGTKDELGGLLTLAFALKVAAATAILTLFYWVVHARKQLVVLSFADHTGDAGMAGAIAALPTQFANDLARLRSLYELTDEAQPQAVSGNDKPIEATVGVDDLGTSLKGAISADTHVNLGPLQIPVGAVLAIGARAFEGPRLTGSVHRIGDQLALIAQVRGGELRGSWRITQADLEDAPQRTPDETIRELTEQLAYRVFTDLSNAGSKQWRAIVSFTAGLRTYRDSTRVHRDQVFKRQQAEQAFIDALDQDQGFARCHYNLGILYRDRGQLASAETVLRRAVTANPDLYDAYYALATVHYRAGHYAETVRVCQLAIALWPSQPSAWDLKGLALRQLDRLEESSRSAKSIHDREEATALAWQALCRSALSETSNLKARRTAELCTRNLAVAHAMAKNYAKSTALFHQATRLDPTATAPHFELGKTLYLQSEWRGLVAEFEAVNEEALTRNDKAVYWACLTEAHTCLAKKLGATGTVEQKLAEDAKQHFAEAVLAADAVTIENDVPVGASVKATWDELRAFQLTMTEKQEESPAQYSARLRAELGRRQQPAWAAARIEIALAKQLEGNPGAATEAQEHLRNAMTHLSSAVIRNEHLYGQLAMAFQRGGKLGEALVYAERAVGLEPQGAWERQVLAEVYWALDDQECALKHWAIGLSLDPRSRDIVRSIAQGYAQRGWSVRRPKLRQESFRQVVKSLRHFLALIEADGSSIPDATSELEVRGFAHFFLGLSLREILEHDTAITHFKIGLAMGYKPVQSAVELGWAYVSAKAFDEAETAYSKAIQTSVKELRKATPAARRTAAEQPAALTGEATPIIQLRALSYLQSAFAFAQRGVNLERAQRRLRYAKRLIDRIDVARRKEYLAGYHDSLGWLYFKREQWQLAVDSLKQAVALTASDAGTYYRLALAYEALGEARDGTNAYWLRKARQAAIDARDADRDGRYASEIDTALKRLEQRLDQVASLSPALIIVPASRGRSAQRTQR